MRVLEAEVSAASPMRTETNTPSASAANEEPTAGASRSRLASHLDRAGLFWSALCTLHCAAPIALAGAALVTGANHGHASHHADVAHVRLQLVLMSTSVALAGLLLVRGYLRRHRVAAPLAVFGVAVAILAASWLAPWPTELIAMGVTTLGLLTLVAAQVLDVVVLRRTGACCVSRFQGESCCGSERG